MNPKDISTAKDPVLRGSLPALRRAGEQARKTAILTGTNLVIVKDGQTVRVPADRLDGRSASTSTP